MGCEVALVRTVNSACESHTTAHLPVSPSSPAGKVLVQHKQAHEMSPTTADVADERISHHAKVGVGEKVLAVTTTARVSSSISCLFYPASLKGQESHLHANRGLELSFEGREGCCLQREELCRCKKTPQNQQE